MAHFQRVAKNGSLLCEKYPEANKSVVMAFAYLHDSCRWSDEEDPGHGPRAARLVENLRTGLLKDFTDEEIAQLKFACKNHTYLDRSGNITIDICFDADRLDLGRVGIVPDPAKMSTEQGAEWAKRLQS